MSSEPRRPPRNLWHLILWDRSDYAGKSLEARKHHWFCRVVSGRDLRHHAVQRHSGAAAAGASLVPETTFAVQIALCEP
ncbi:unnamed protein product [Discula destructiva]